MDRESILKLMKAVDETIPIPTRDLDKPFLMPIEDVFSIAGRGTVATGRIEAGKNPHFVFKITVMVQGQIKVQDEVEILGFKTKHKTTVTGVETFKKILDEGQAGDNVGLLLRGLKRNEVLRGRSPSGLRNDRIRILGQVIAAPGTIRTGKSFEAEIYALTKEEGGRHKPFFSKYRPQFFFRTADIAG